MMTQVGILVGLILLNAFFAGSELAFISINNNKLKNMVENGNKKARLVLTLKERPNKFLSTIQIGVTLASILSGAAATETFAQFLTQLVVSTGVASEAIVKPIAFLVVTLVIMFLMLVFGELVPKRIAMKNPERFTFFVIYPIYYLAKFTTPLVHLLSFSTNLVLRLIGIDPNSVDDEVTEEEIRLMVDAGEINIQEKEMINNIFEFDNIDVADIMTHRTDIVGIDSTSSFEDIMNLVDEERYTRYPVYEESIDNIIGIIHLRDLLRYMKFSKELFDIKDLIRQPYFVPDSKQTDELFRELQSNKTHIAVVIDEYGGTAGIVTMEDMIEEIMGNIMDEYDIDEVEHDIVQVHEDEYLVDGSADIEDLENILGIDLPIDDYDTVSGFVIGEIGRIPTAEDVEGDESDVEFHGYKFSILELDEKTVSKVRVIKLDKHDDNNPES